MKRLCFILALAAVSAGAVADADPCDPTLPLPELGRCVDEQFRRADRELNIDYAAAMGALDAGRRARMRERQRAWIRLRDDACGLAAGRMAGPDHPLHPVLLQNCRAWITASRSAELRRKDEGAYCDPAGTQAQATQCAHEEYLRADRELNRIYVRLLSGRGEAERERIRQPQRRWLAELDPACREATRAEAGATIWPMLYSTCLATKTQERVSELIRMLD